MASFRGEQILLMNRLGSGICIFQDEANVFKISNKRGTEGVKGFWIFTIRKEFEISDGNFVADWYFMFWERLFMTCDLLVLLLYIVTIKTYFYSILLFIPS